jgi:hypothetical protein
MLQEYFADAPQPLFAARGYEEDMEKAQVGTRHPTTPAVISLLQGALD